MTALEYTSLIQSVALSLKPAAMHLTRDSDDAKDLVQETLLKALSNREKFKPDTNIKAWLYTIMRNTFINNYNKITKRISSVDTSEYLQCLNMNQNFIAQNKGTASFVMRDINKAITRLSEEHRKPFMMYYVGYKYQEIAEELSLPIGTVKNRIHIARKELKQMLEVYRQEA